MKKINDAISQIKSEYVLDAIEHSTLSGNTPTQSSTLSAKPRSNPKARYRTALMVALIAVFSGAMILSMTFLMFELLPPGDDTPSLPHEEQTTSAHTEFLDAGSTIAVTQGTGDPATTTAPGGHTVNLPVSYASAGEVNAEVLSASDFNLSKQDETADVPIFKITTFTELSAFISLYNESATPEKEQDDTVTLENAVQAYDEAFFAERSLLIAYVNDSVPENLELSRCTVSDNTVDISIKGSETTSSKGSETTSSKGSFLVIQLTAEDAKGVTNCKVSVTKHNPGETVSTEATPIETNNSDTMAPSYTRIPEETSSPETSPSETFGHGTSNPSYTKVPAETSSPFETADHSPETKEPGGTPGTPNDTKDPSDTFGTPEETRDPNDTPGTTPETTTPEEPYETYRGLKLMLNTETNSYEIVGYDSTLLLYIERNMIPEDKTDYNRLYLPFTYNHLAITGIRSLAFKECTYFNELVIPEEIQSIALDAFAGCKIRSMYFFPKSCTEHIGSKQLVYFTVDTQALITYFNYSRSTISAIEGTKAELIYCKYYSDPNVD